MPLHPQAQAFLDTTDALANAWSCKLVALDDRLAPEHEFPPDCRTATPPLHWLAAHQYGEGYLLTRVLHAFFRPGQVFDDGQASVAYAGAAPRRALS